MIVNKKLAKRVGLKEAILLSDLISKEQYFIDNGQIKNGFFFNTAKNIEKDTTLSRHKQSIAIKNLIKKGFIKTKLMGVPATLHFKIIENKILKFLNTGVKKNKNLDVKEVKTNKNKVIKINNNITNRRLHFEEIVFQVTDVSKDLLKEFCDYWTEENKSRTKMKFELQKTFDINRRLKRWVKNEKKWNTSGSGKIESQIDVWKKVHNKILGNEKN